MKLRHEREIPFEKHACISARAEIRSNSNVSEHKL